MHRHVPIGGGADVCWDKDESREMMNCGLLVKKDFPNNSVELVYRLRFCT